MYVGCIIHRGASVPQPGITIDFVRTGGAPTLRSTTTVTSDSSGVFLLDLGPLSRGDVVGDLTVHGFEASTTYVARNVIVPAADGFRADTSFGIGLQLPYFGTVQRFNSGVPGVRVTMKRTGGIPISPDSVSMVTASDGLFNTYPFHATNAGELVVDITVSPPAPSSPFVIKAVHLPTVDAASRGVHFIDIDLNKPPP
jgi:hypothetical protein